MCFEAFQAGQHALELPRCGHLLHASCWPSSSTLAVACPACDQVYTDPGSVLVYPADPVDSVDPGSVSDEEVWPLTAHTRLRVEALHATCVVVEDEDDLDDFDDLVDFDDPDALSRVRRQASDADALLQRIYAVLRQQVRRCAFLDRLLYEMHGLGHA